MYWSWFRLYSDDEQKGDTSSTRTRRGGSCLRFDDKTFFIYRTCVRSAPCAVRRACVLCANLLCCCFSRRWPACDHVGTQHQANRSSHFTLHSSNHALHASHLHFTLHSSPHLKSSDSFAPHVTSSDVFSSHPIPSHTSSKQVLLNCFHLIRALKKAHLNSSQLFCTPESPYF